VDVIELLPRLYFIRLPAGYAYLWRDPDGLADLRHLVLTHFHGNHIGSPTATTSAAQPTSPSGAR
jgi:hypothetical protein